MLVKISDKAKAPALLGAVVLGDVHVTNPPIFIKKTLQIVRSGPVREAIDLERNHPAGVWRRTSPPPVPVVAARHPALSFQASLVAIDVVIPGRNNS